MLFPWAPTRSPLCQPECRLAIAPKPLPVRVEDILDDSLEGSSSIVHFTASLTSASVIKEEAAIDCVYVASKFELDQRNNRRYVEAHKLIGQQDRSFIYYGPAALELIRLSNCRKVVNGENPFGLEKILTHVLWVGDNDPQSANMGALKYDRAQQVAEDDYLELEESMYEQAFKIDHGFSFYKLNAEVIDPFNRFAVAPLTLSGGKVSTQPTNHAADYAQWHHGAFYFSDDFLNELKKITERKKAATEENFRRSLMIVRKTYESFGNEIALEALQKFATHIGIEDFSDVRDDPLRFANMIADYLTARMVERQESLKKLHNKLLIARQIATQPNLKGMIGRDWWLFGKFKLHNAEAFTEQLEKISREDVGTPDLNQTKYLNRHLKRAEYAATLASFLQNVDILYLKDATYQSHLFSIAECLAEHAIYKYKPTQRNSIIDKQQGLMTILKLFNDFNNKPTVDDIKRIVQQYPLMYEGLGRSMRRWLDLPTSSTTERLVAGLVNVLPVDKTGRASLHPLKPGKEFYRAEQYQTGDVDKELPKVLKEKIKARMETLRKKITSAKGNDTKEAKLYFKWSMLRKLKDIHAQKTIESDSPHENIIKINNQPLMYATEEQDENTIEGLNGSRHIYNDEITKTPLFLSDDELIKDKDTFDLVKEATEAQLIAAKKGFCLSVATLSRIVRHIVVIDNRLNEPSLYQSLRSKDLRKSWEKKRAFLVALQQASINETLYVDEEGKLQSAAENPLPESDTSCGRSFRSEVAAIVDLAKKDIVQRRARVVADFDWKVKRAVIVHM